MSINFNSIIVVYFDRESSKQEQIFLKAVVQEFRASGLEEAMFSKVLLQHVSLCRIEGI